LSRFSVYAGGAKIALFQAPIPPRPPATARQPPPYRPNVVPSVADYARGIVQSQRWGAGGLVYRGYRPHRPGFPPPRHGGPRMRRGGPNAQRSLLAEISLIRSLGRQASYLKLGGGRSHVVAAANPVRLGSAAPRPAEGGRAMVPTRHRSNRRLREVDPDARWLSALPRDPTDTVR